MLYVGASVPLGQAPRKDSLMKGMWNNKHQWGAHVRGVEDRCMVCGLTADECIEYMQSFCTGYTQLGLDRGERAVVFSQAPLVLVRRD